MYWYICKYTTLITSTGTADNIVVNIDETVFGWICHSNQCLGVTKTQKKNTSCLEMVDMVEKIIVFLINQVEFV